MFRQCLVSVAPDSVAHACQLLYSCKSLSASHSDALPAVIMKKRSSEGENEIRVEA